MIVNLKIKLTRATKRTSNQANEHPSNEVEEKDNTSIVQECKSRNGSANAVQQYASNLHYLNKPFKIELFDEKISCKDSNFKLFQLLQLAITLIQYKIDKKVLTC
jgi:hypothetical protein